MGADTHRRPVRAAAVLAVVVVALSACGATGEGEPQGPVPAPVLPDGEVFAMVTVGEHDGVTTLAVDVAEMLTGADAKAKAVEDGVIAEGEDLPNDFYIANDEQVYELANLGADPVIMVISGNDTTRMLEIDEEQLIGLWEGTYSGEPVYGVIPGTPIPMELTVADGVVTRATAVYLP